MDAAAKRAIQSKWTRSISTFTIVAGIAVLATAAYRKTGEHTEQQTAAAQQNRRGAAPRSNQLSGSIDACAGGDAQRWLCARSHPIRSIAVCVRAPALPVCCCSRSAALLWLSAAAVLQVLLPLATWASAWEELERLRSTMMMTTMTSKRDGAAAERTRSSRIYMHALPLPPPSFLSPSPALRIAFSPQDTPAHCEFSNSARSSLATAPCAAETTSVD